MQIDFVTRPDETGKGRVIVDGMFPCPFCGRSDVLGIEPHPEGRFLSVRCRVCGCIGPARRAESEREAVNAWMHRAEQPNAKVTGCLEAQPSPEAIRYADYILNHYSRDSQADKICLARDLERRGLVVHNAQRGVQRGAERIRCNAGLEQFT